MQEIQEPARPMAEPQGSWLFSFPLCPALSLNSKEECPLGKSGENAFPFPRQQPELFMFSDKLGDKPSWLGILQK